VVGYVVPAEAIGSVIGVVGVLAVYSLIQSVSLRERVSKLEEWVRQSERRNGGRR